MTVIRSSRRNWTKNSRPLSDCEYCARRCAHRSIAYCERLVGTVRRECLDFMIPMSEGHLRRILQPWVEHYNKGRPHSSLGPGMPEESPARQLPTPRRHRHKLPPDCQIRAKDILFG